MPYRGPSRSLVRSVVPITCFATCQGGTAVCHTAVRGPSATPSGGSAGPSVLPSGELRGRSLFRRGDLRGRVLTRRWELRGQALSPRANCVATLGVLVARRRTSMGRDKRGEATVLVSFGLGQKHGSSQHCSPKPRPNNDGTRAVHAGTCVVYERDDPWAHVLLRNAFTAHGLHQHGRAAGAESHATLRMLWI